MTPTKFWRTMGEYYGSRWTEQYTPTPTPAWIAVIERAHARELEVAISLLSARHEDKRGFPPTLPEFQALLARAHAREGGDDSTDYGRGYWRACVVDELGKLLCHDLRIVKPQDLEFYIAQHGATFARLRALLDELGEMEERNGGQRTPGMHRMCADRCRALVNAAVELTPLEQRRA